MVPGAVRARHAYEWNARGTTLMRFGPWDISLKGCFSLDTGFCEFVRSFDFRFSVRETICTFSAPIICGIDTGNARAIEFLANIEALCFEGKGTNGPRQLSTRCTWYRVEDMFEASPSLGHTHAFRLGTSKHTRYTKRTLYRIKMSLYLVPSLPIIFFDRFKTGCIAAPDDTANRQNDRQLNVRAVRRAVIEVEEHHADARQPPSANQKL